MACFEMSGQTYKWEKLHLYFKYTQYKRGLQGWELKAVSEIRIFIG